MIKTHKIIQVAKSDKDYAVDSPTNLVIADGDLAVKIVNKL